MDSQHSREISPHVDKLERFQATLPADTWDDPSRRPRRRSPTSMANLLHRSLHPLSPLISISGYSRQQNTRSDPTPPGVLLHARSFTISQKPDIVSLPCRSKVAPAHSAKPSPLTTAQYTSCDLTPSYRKNKVNAVTKGNMWRIDDPGLFL